MLIVDAHLDLAWNALQWNRNLQHSVYTIRTGESQLSGAGRGQGTVALPDRPHHSKFGLFIALTSLRHCTGSAGLLSRIGAGGRYPPDHGSGETRRSPGCLAGLGKRFVSTAPSTAAWCRDQHGERGPDLVSGAIASLERGRCPFHRSCALRPRRWPSPIYEVGGRTVESAGAVDMSFSTIIRGRV